VINIVSAPCAPPIYPLHANKLVTDLTVATRVKKRKAEIKIRAFLAILWSDYRHWEAIVLFMQSCKLPTNWINRFPP